MVATSGHRLLDADAEDGVRRPFERVDLVTPNAPELAVLAGAAPAGTWTHLVDQALTVSERHEVMLLAKGGHSATPRRPTPWSTPAAG